MISILEKCENMGTKFAEKKMLIQGFGMGRIIKDIYDRFKPELIEGIEDNPINYIFSEYFLSKEYEESIIFPFIHNFINNKKEETPYDPVKIIKEMKDDEEKIYTNYGSFA